MDKKGNTKLIIWAVIALVIGVIIGMLLTNVVVGNSKKVLSLSTTNAAIAKSIFSDIPPETQWTVKYEPQSIREDNTCNCSESFTYTSTDDYGHILTITKSRNWPCTGSNGNCGCCSLGYTGIS